MNLQTALAQIATQLNIDDDPYVYAQEDTVGGYHPSPAKAKWHIGSIFEVEGQVLYALVRALKPKVVVNLGTFHGCSAMHILNALKANGEGELIAVDNDPKWEAPRGYKSMCEVISGDALQYVENVMPARRVGMVFEDLMHNADEVAHVWTHALPKLKKGGVILSHDVSHNVVGQAVKNGIAASGYDYSEYLIEPSDCGLAIGQKE